MKGEVGKGKLGVGWAWEGETGEWVEGSENGKVRRGSG